MVISEDIFISIGQGNNTVHKKFKQFDRQAFTTNNKGPFRIFSRGKLKIKAPILRNQLQH